MNPFECYRAGRVNTVLLPVHSAYSKDEIDAALVALGMADVVVFQSSGSTGEARLVCHSRAGLEASAAAVNGHLKATSDDVWLRALPVIHVGGFGVEVRAEASKSGFYALDGAWGVERYAAACRAHMVTLTSLVPTQVFDLVEHECPSPEAMRAVLVGGGYLDESLEQRARVLGWPIVRTYGLSEAGSQVATQLGDELSLLPHLEAEIGDGGRLKLRGASMALGYLCQADGGAWKFEALSDGDHWFQTDDLVELDGKVLRFVGRASARVKVLGELVDVEALERAFLARIGADFDAAIVDVADPRREHALVLVIHNRTNVDDVAPMVAAFNASVAGFERISRVVKVRSIPRSDLGKVRRGELRKLVIETGK